MTQEELINVFKYIVKKCDILINNVNYVADVYTQDIVEDIAELCNHILDGDYGKLVEVKEVDLEKELANYYNDNFSQCNDGTLLSEKTGTELTYHDYECIAKHFFELGLKAQKGE